MPKQSLASIAKSVRTAMKKHSPEILTGIGIAGMITTTVMAVKATPKALILLEEKKDELDTDRLEPKDIIKTAWPCYIPAAVVGAISVFCLIGASSTNLRRNAALATAYIVPAVKKAISDIVTTGIDMILYGEAGRSKKNGTASKVSYRNYYDQGADRVRAGSAGNRRNTPDYDDILFDTRGDAEAVLDAMNDIISQYGTVSVSDFYDLARVPNDNFTMNRYGWTNIGGATAVRVRDGYILKLPRAIPLN